ncbi:MAG: glycosyl transferase [Alphaproteobacteria bacterium]|nr:glycosyl transferase [Alphaproteobacteria bacterium]
MNRPRLFFAVTHLFGVGHLRRVLRIAEAAEAAGAETLIASGGRPVDLPGFARDRLVQIPPLHAAGPEARVLLDETGAVADPACLRLREDRLAAAFRAFAPDLLVTELFPFGRWKLRGEFLRLLDLAGAAGVPAVASLRDILEPVRHEDRLAAQRAIAATRYAALLVHGDPALTGIDPLFGEGLSGQIHFTGLIAPSSPPEAPRTDDILVVAGGGAGGARLFETALAASRLPEGRRRRWRFRTGAFGAIADPGLPHVDMRPAGEDMPGELARARLCISQAGYNMVAEILATRTPALLVPQAEGRQTEQTRRAAALEARGLAAHLPQTALTPRALLAAIGHVPAPARADTLRLEGAESTAAHLLALARTRSSPRLSLAGGRS